MTPEPRPQVARMAPYKPPSEGRAGKLRLDFNENTSGASPAVVQALQEALDPEYLTIYPEYSLARPKLAAHFGVSADEILLTNGTDEAIQVLVNTFVNEDDAIFIAEPTYAMYRFYSELAGARIREDLTAATRLAFIANPNNPTGAWKEREECLELIEQFPDTLFLFDEAYFEFSGITVLDQIAHRRNLFVSRTFSKAYGMAGLRMGCLFTCEDNVRWLRKAQSPYSVNHLAITAALAAIEDLQFTRNYAARAVASREQIEAALAEMGIPSHPSRGNFLLFDVGDRAIEIRDRLREAGVLIRDRSYEAPGCVRVTCGPREHAERFLEELKRIW
jgi:histidinol-phosphate aminotransferase